MDTTVLIAGGGVAGLSAAIFTARAGLDTLVVDADESILARNAHLENFPGFPGGIDARRFLAMTREQAETAGCTLRDGRVADVTERDDGFAVALAGGETVTAETVVAATKSNADYLDSLPVERFDRGSKTYLAVDEDGRTGVDGLYAAGRLAGQYHQAIVCAGHGATVGVTVVLDAPVDFYHDWVTPEGYFTERGREVPPGCEEIDDGERREREAAARERLREWLADAPEDEPTMHPSVPSEE